MNNIPEKLIEIGRQLFSQDNRCTANPMFCVQIKVRDSGYDPEYSDETHWVNMSSGDYETVDQEPEDSEGWEEFGYKDRWETVMISFTEAGCKQYLEREGHNLKRRAHNGEVEIYVESFGRCSEMIAIREFLMQAAKEAEVTKDGVDK
jgi:hypothetical protein